MTPMDNPINQLDRKIINQLQTGMDIVERPFQALAQELNISEQQIADRLQQLLDNGTLTRFGPLYNVEKLGGEFTLCAQAIPAEQLDQVAEQVNALAEIAHNYEREHEFNQWFVIAVERPEKTQQVIEKIEKITGYPVYAFPKLEEFFVQLNLVA